MMKKKKDNGYKKVKEGVFLHPKFDRVMEHYGYSTRIYWSPQMLDFMQRNYATTLNQDLADWLGVSVTTVIRKARQLGLRKAPEWMRQMSVERCHLATAANARKGNSGQFKKGVRHNPAGEFKKGHKETPEGRQKRIAALRRYNLTHPKEVAAARRKAWQNRRKGEGQSANVGFLDKKNRRTKGVSCVPAVASQQSWSGAQPIKKETANPEGAQA